MLLTPHHYLANFSNLSSWIDAVTLLIMKITLSQIHDLDLLFENL